MAYEHGTANGHKDLLAKIKTFVTTNTSLVSANQNWTVLNNDPTGNEVYFKAPGLTGTESVYLGIKCHENVGSDYYNWIVSGSAGYSPAATFESQPNNHLAYVSLWNHQIPYWLVANGQRLILVAKISNIYTATYLGKFSQFAHPHQYPYPVFVSGATGKTERWSDTWRHTIFQNPDSNSNCAVFQPGNDWRHVYNRSGNSKYSNSNATGAFIMPTDTIHVASKIGENPDGTYSLLPFFLVSSTPAKNVLGELDGVYWVSGHNNSSENILTIDGSNYLVFQNVVETDWKSYAAMELV